MSSSDFSTTQGTINSIISICKDHHWLNSQIAYCLATIQHETNNTFKPVFEAYYIKNPERYLRKLRYYPYYGRGYVQLTWRDNYLKYTKKLNKVGINIDLVKNPDLAMRPDISTFVIIDGFELGEFTGKKISDYINVHKTDFLNARRCINGIDKAQKIATLASHWLSVLNNKSNPVENA